MTNANTINVEGKLYLEISPRTMAYIEQLRRIDQLMGWQGELTDITEDDELPDSCADACHLIESATLGDGFGMIGDYENFIKDYLSGSIIDDITFGIGKKRQETIELLGGTVEKKYDDRGDGCCEECEYCEKPCESNSSLHKEAFYDGLPEE